MTRSGNAVATPLRRLSSWLIDSISFALAGPAIFFAVAFLSFTIDDILWDLPAWGHLMGSVLLVVVIYIILIGGYLLVSILTVMNEWQIVSILSPPIVLFILSIFAYIYTSSFMVVAVLAAISSLISYVIWMLISFSNGQTVGKRLVGIQAVRQSGESVGWGLMFVREVIKSLLHLFLIGFIIDAIMLLSDKVEWQSVSDRIAGTVVVHAG